MKYTMPVDLEVLRGIVIDYFAELGEEMVFLKTWKGGWWEDKTAKQREDYIKHDERVNCKWNAISDVCRLLDIDSDALIPIIKSIQRWENNHGKYDRCVYLSYLHDSSMEHLFQCISKKYQSDFWIGYYASTGRKIKV